MPSAGRPDDRSTPPAEATPPAAPRGPPAADTATLPIGDEAGAGAARAAVDAARAAGGDEAVALPARFEVRGRLGKGGMAVVLEVRDRALARDVAVKILPAELRWNGTLRARFLREARAAATLRHPNLVTVYDLDPGGAFIVMELVRGGSLRDRLADGPLPAAEVRRIGRAFLEGLAAAHAAGVVHRDVKPANVLLGHGDEVKLADFGIASFGDSDLTTTGRNIGTPAYMPPEQLRGRRVDARADVYAAGATLFEAATGRKLHDEAGTVEDPGALVRAATGDDVLAHAVARAVRDLPDDRFPDAASFAAALAPDAPVTLAALPAAERGRRAARAPARTVGAALLVGFAALAVGLALRDRTAPTGAPASADAAASAAATGAAPVTPAPPARPAGGVALLPFDDRTGNPLLDFAAAGLPHLMEMEMRRLTGAPLFGYYRLLERVSGPGAPPADWLAAARTLGAAIVVRGALTAAGVDVHVELIVERVDGARLARLVRDVPVDQVPESVRGLAAEVAALATGRSVAAAPRVPRALELERGLQLGIAALERGDLAQAVTELRTVLAADATMAEAHYYLAVALWWQIAPPDAVLAEVEAALGGDLGDASRGFLEGLRLLVQKRLDEAIVHFRALAERFPDHRDVLYGLTEALYHGGHAADGVAVYRTVCELSPRFRLGLVHALTYYTARTDERGMAWALARADVVGEAPRDIWGAKILMSRGDVAGAIDVLRRVSADGGGAGGGAEVARLAEIELVRAYAVHGDVELALALSNRLAEEAPMGALLEMRGLSALRGDARASAHWRDVARREAAMRPAGFPRANAWIEVLLMDPPDAPAAWRHEVAAALDAAPDDVRHMEIWQLGHAYVAGAAGDSAAVAAAATSSFPEVAAMAEAFLAEGRGDVAGAAAAWERAAADAGNGRFLPLEHYERARVRRAAGDAAETLRACREVVAPRLFDWSWASRVSPCMLWSAEAAAKLGRAGEAREAFERLLAARSAAAPADPLVLAARTGLAALPAPPAAAP
ncbi:MAG TPA: protein kinase [Myxococcota bacterium]|jgi:tetratricopeptide (TPR) repeat protein|nr:protein kinase [Myxococcota bacterium]